MGRTHGETVEQEWAYINLAALSTREMGPGARHATLDDSWGGWNWRKILGFGTYAALSWVERDRLIFTTNRFISRKEPLEGSRDVLETTPGRRRFYCDIPS